MIVKKKGNKSFFMPGMPIEYRVLVSDKEDGPNIDSSSIFVSVTYDVRSNDLFSSGHQGVNSPGIGKNLTQSLDCKGCHKEREKSIGPSYVDVSRRYKHDDNPHAYLRKKIIEGGSGAWGEVVMPAHPNLSEKDTDHIISWIMSLTEIDGRIESLPASGIIIPPSTNPDNSLIIAASYKDGGIGHNMSLTGSDFIYLPNNIFTVEKFSHVTGFLSWTAGGEKMLLTPALKGSFVVNSLDLTDVKSVHINLGHSGERTVNAAFNFEVYLDSPNGTPLGRARYDSFKDNEKLISVPIPLNEVKDGKLHNLSITCASLNPEKTSDYHLKIFSLRFEGK